MGATDEKMVDTRQVSIMIAVEEQALVMGPIDGNRNELNIIYYNYFYKLLIHFKYLVPVTVTLDQIKQMAEGLGMDVRTN